MSAGKHQRCWRQGEVFSWNSWEHNGFVLLFSHMCNMVLYSYSICTTTSAFPRVLSQPSHFHFQCLMHRWQVDECVHRYRFIILNLDPTCQTTQYLFFSPYCLPFWESPSFPHLSFTFITLVFLIWNLHMKKDCPIYHLESGLFAWHNFQFYPNVIILFFFIPE